MKKLVCVLLALGVGDVAIAGSLGEGLRGTFNAWYNHTIAQPACEGTLRLPDDAKYLSTQQKKK